MNKEIFMNLLQKREYKTVRNILNVMNGVDIATLMEMLKDKDLALAFRLIPKDKAAEVFANMNNLMQSYLVEIFTQKELKEILNEMFLDDTVDLLEDLPADLVTRILVSVNPEKRRQINILLKYPIDSAGSVMTTEYVDLRKSTTVAEALRHIKRTDIHKETIYTCYILENRKLVGTVSAKDLLTMDDSITMAELMETEIITVTTHTDQEEVAKLFSKYDLLAIPVLDTDGMMVGIITFDDARDVLEEETTEDMALMSAITPNAKSYFETSVLIHAKHRIMWLLLLMLSATFTGLIIARYQAIFQIIPLLMAFIPMLMDTGGNCGSQSSTLIIRGLALDEIHFSDIFRVMSKEFRISLIVGIGLAIANGARLIIMHQNVDIAVIVACSLIGTIILSKMIGCTLPILAQKVNLDPAIMATPLITTIVDTCSTIIYFKIAELVFHLIF